MNDLKAEYVKIWDENAETLRKCCLSKTQGSSEETVDIITQVFTLLWEKIISDGMPSDTKTWLYATLSKTITEKHKPADY